MVFMLQGIIRVNQDIVQVSCTKDIKVIEEDIVHIPLIRSRAIGQAFPKDLALVGPISRTERREFF
jgi:hypothetical protein